MFRFIRCSLFLLFTCFGSTDAIAKRLSGDSLQVSLDDYAAAGSKELSRLIQTNAQNLQTGQEHLNQYIFGFKEYFERNPQFDAEYIRWKGNMLSFQFTLNDTLKRINARLRQKQQPEVYVGLDDRLGSLVIKNKVDPQTWQTVQTLSDFNNASKFVIEKSSYETINQAYSEIYTKVAAFDNLAGQAGRGIAIIGAGLFITTESALDGNKAHIWYASNLKGSADNDRVDKVYPSVMAGWSQYPENATDEKIHFKLDQFVHRVENGLSGKLQVVNIPAPGKNFVEDCLNGEYGDWKKVDFIVLEKIGKQINRLGTRFWKDYVKDSLKLYNNLTPTIAPQFEKNLTIYADAIEITFPEITALDERFNYFEDWVRQLQNCFTNYSGNVNRKTLVPRCVWYQSPLAGIASISGFIDAGYETVVDIADFGELMKCWTISGWGTNWNPIFDSDCAKKREDTRNFLRQLKQIDSKEKVLAVGGELWNQSKTWFTDQLCADPLDPTNSECFYKQGKTIFEIASLFIGVGEVKASLKTFEVAKLIEKVGKLTQLILDLKVPTKIKFITKPGGRLFCGIDLRETLEFTTEPLNKVLRTKYGINTETLTGASGGATQARFFADTRTASNLPEQLTNQIKQEITPNDISDLDAIGEAVQLVEVTSPALVSTQVVDRGIGRIFHKTWNNYLLVGVLTSDAVQFTLVINTATSQQFRVPNSPLNPTCNTCISKTVKPQFDAICYRLRQQNGVNVEPELNRICQQAPDTALVNIAKELTSWSNTELQLFLKTDLNTLSVSGICVPDEYLASSLSVLQIGILKAWKALYNSTSGGASHDRINIKLLKLIKDFCAQNRGAYNKLIQEPKFAMKYYTYLDIFNSFLALHKKTQNSDALGCLFEDFSNFNQFIKNYYSKANIDKFICDDILSQETKFIGGNWHLFVVLHPVDTNWGIFNRFEEHHFNDQSDKLSTMFDCTFINNSNNIQTLVECKNWSPDYFDKKVLDVTGHPDHQSFLNQLVGYLKDFRVNSFSSFAYVFKKRGRLNESYIQGKFYQMFVHDADAIFKANPKLYENFEFQEQPINQNNFRQWLLSISHSGQEFKTIFSFLKSY